MLIKVKCPNGDCPAYFQVEEEFLGKHVRCKKCTTKFTIVHHNGTTGSNGKFTSTGKSQPTSSRKPVAEEPLPLPLPDEEPQQEPLPLPDEEPEPGIRSWLARRRFRLSSQGIRLWLTRRRIILTSAGAALFVMVAGIIGILSWMLKPTHTVYGGIEISSTEIRAFAFDFFTDPTLGYDFKLISESPWKEEAQFKLTKSGDFDPEALKETVASIAKLHKQIQSKHGVKSDKIVIAYGYQIFKKMKESKVEESRVEDNRKLFERLVKEATGSSVSYVENSNAELDLKIKVLIPEKMMDKTVLVDLGNSGCRGGCLGEKNKFVADGVQAFVESIKNRVIPAKPGIVRNDKQKDDKKEVFGGYGDKQMDLYIKASSELVDSKFREPLIGALQDNKKMTGRQRVELIGGIPWVVATYKNPVGRDQTHTRLSVQQIEEFYKDVRRDKYFPKFSLPPGLEEQLKNKLTVDVERMKSESLSPLDLVAGTEMLQVLSEQLKFGVPDREIYFHNYGQEAVVLGYMQKMWEQSNKK